MSLAIYSEPNPNSFFSKDSEFTNPIRQSFDGQKGGSKEWLFYVRNDDSTKTYTSITLYVNDGGDGIVDGSNGFSFKLRAGNTQPLIQEWNVIDPGNTIDLEDITDISTYLPFWVRVTVPTGADIGSYSAAKFRIAATKNTA